MCCGPSARASGDPHRLGEGGVGREGRGEGGREGEGAGRGGRGGREIVKEEERRHRMSKGGSIAEGELIVKLREKGERRK